MLLLYMIARGILLNIKLIYQNNKNDKEFFKKLIG
jgi:hypothetical protein